MQTFMFEAKMRLSTFHSSVKKEEGELVQQQRELELATLCLS